MDTKNVVRLSHALQKCPIPAQATPHQYVQVLNSRNTYRRLYEQNTAQLAQARIETHKLRGRVQQLEEELAAHQAGAPMRLLEEAVKLMTGMSLDRLQFEKATGGVVRMPAKTIEFTTQGEALVSRAAPLLTHGESVR